MKVKSEQSKYYQVLTGYGTMHININYTDAGPNKIFVNLAPVGTEISGLIAIVGVVSSKFLEGGGNPWKLIKHLQSAKGDRPVGFGPQRVESLSHGLAIALRSCLEDMNMSEEVWRERAKKKDIDSPEEKMLDCPVSPAEPSSDHKMTEEEIIQGHAHVTFCAPTHQPGHCPQCFSPLTYAEGCEKCTTCDYSKCS